MDTPRRAVLALTLTAALLVGLLAAWTARTPDPQPYGTIVASQRIAASPLPVTPEPTPEPVATPTAQPRQRSAENATGAHEHASVNVKPGSVKARIVATWPGNAAKALRVVACESNFNPRAVSKSGRYHGLFQFDLQTWRSVGGSGLPSRASVEEQTKRAWKLRQARAWAPWPTCGKR